MILEQISSGGKLNPLAALSFERMCAAYGKTIPTVSTTRTFAEQEYLYRGYVAHKVGFNFALAPGRSVHEQGFAVDFGESAWKWLTDHGNDFGWIRTNPNEMWHREYKQLKDLHYHILPPIEEKGFLVALNDYKQDQMYDWMKQTTEAIGRLEAMYGAADGRNRVKSADQSRDLIREAHAGVGRIEKMCD